MNISTSGQLATFLLGQQLPNGDSIYLDSNEWSSYSTNPTEVYFNTSTGEAKDLFKSLVHYIAHTSNILPGGD